MFLGQYFGHFVLFLVAYYIILCYNSEMSREYQSENISDQPKLTSLEKFTEDAKFVLRRRILELESGFKRPDRFEMVLRGVSSPLLHKELGAGFAEHNLEDNADMLITSDGFNGVELQKLCIPLSNRPGEFFTVKQATVNENTSANSPKHQKYISNIERGRQETGTPYIHPSSYGDKLLRSYGITPPPTDEDEYNNWRYNLLDKAADGWQLVERKSLVQMPTSEELSGEIYIIREPFYKPGEEISMTTALRYSISLPGYNIVEEISLESSADNIPDLAMTRYVIDKMSNSGIKPQPTEIAFSESSYENFSNLLKLASEANSKLL